jgi:hypothetical protein
LTIVPSVDRLNPQSDAIFFGDGAADFVRSEDLDLFWSHIEMAEQQRQHGLPDTAEAQHDNAVFDSGVFRMNGHFGTSGDAAPAAPSRDRSVNL